MLREKKGVDAFLHITLIRVNREIYLFLKLDGNK